MTISSIPFPRYPVNNITPFTYRDGFTYLELIERLREKINEIVENDELQNDAINDFVDVVNAALADILSSLIGYTIEVSENTYTASMMDGSEFTAYTMTGVDNLLVAFRTEIQTLLNTELADMETAIATAVTNLTNQINQTESTLTTAVNDAIAQMNASVTDMEANIADLEADLNSKFRHIHNVLNYGATGDGVTNDSAGIQAAVNAALPGDVILLPQGEFRMHSPVTIPSDKTGLIITGNATLTASSANGFVRFLDIDADNVTVKGLGFDGANYVANGIRVGGLAPIITGCTMRRFRSTTAGARAIHVRSDGGCYISGNTITDVESVGDDTIGNDNGASRGIVVEMSAIATVRSYIVDNEITNIVGEEGDAIHIIAMPSGGTEKFYVAHAHIADNRISEFSRRAIKIQASECRIISNTINTTIPRGTLMRYGINIINSDRIEIRDNHLQGDDMEAIYLGNNAINPSRGTLIVGNHLVLGESNIGIYTTQTNRVVVDSNTVVDGGFPVRVMNGSDNIVRNNYFETRRFSRSAEVVFVAAEASRPVIEGNYFTGSGTATQPVISCYAEQSTIINNIDLTFTTFGFLRIGGGGWGTFVDGNKSIAATFIRSSGTETNNLVVGSNQAPGANKVFFSGAIPTTSHATTLFNRGDVCYNTGSNNGTVKGWICTALGSPGTWVTL